MSSRFAPCPECARHVKEGDSACPFCGAGVSFVRVPAARTAAGRLSRSALFAVSAVSAALATTGCSSSSSPTDGGPGATGDATSNETGSAQPLYGAVAPPDDAGGTGGFEGGSVQPLYGAVAPTDASPERFEGGAIALYGGSPINHG
jgi:hypothetical protein